MYTCTPAPRRWDTCVVIAAAATSDAPSLYMSGPLEVRNVMHAFIVSSILAYFLGSSARRPLILLIFEGRPYSLTKKIGCTVHSLQPARAPAPLYRV